MSTKHQKSLKIHQNPFFNPKNYKLFTLGLFSFLSAYVVASIFTPVKNSDASTVTITNSLTGYYVSITSADNIPIDVEASPMGQLAAAKDTINVNTNSPKGYRLYLSTSSADNNIYKAGSAENASMGYFSATSGTLPSPSKLTQNTWGFSLTAQDTTTPEDTATWAAVPVLAEASNNQIAELNTNNNPDGTNYDIYYGVNASTTLPSGDYTTEITYTAFSEGVNSFPTMQTFTAAECNALEYDQAINLTDERDGKYYRVTRMKDNNCWMTQNLALDGTDDSGKARLLTPQDSNVTTNHYLAPNIVNGTASTADAIQIYSGSTNGVVDDSFATTEQTATDGTKMPYGNLYNFMAATAGVGTATSTSEITESICPKGWRLPGYDNDYSYSYLFSKYNLPTTNTTDATAVAKVQQSPLYFPASNRYINTTAPTNIHGSYWMRLVDGNSDLSKAFRFYDASGEFNVRSLDNKKSGFSVRCVFVSPKLADITTMQAMTTDICNATLIGETASLTDTRGGGSGGTTTQKYGVLKAKDGNCWMTDNLNLYNKSISAADSDFSTPSTYTIPAGITATTDWDTNNYQTKKVEVAHGLGSSATQDQSYWGEVFYNWTVAVAKETTEGVTTAPNTSICPKGWTLPTNGDRGVDKSWAKLLDAYGVTTGAQLLTTPLGFTKYYGAWYWSFVSEYAQGVYGVFWSGTPSSEANAYDLYYRSGGVYPQDHDTKGVGFSIRCVAR